jgi:hypothetical protein
VATPFSFCKISKSKFYCEKNFYPLTVFVFAIVGANFSERSGIFQKMISSRVIRIHQTGLPDFLEAKAIVCSPRREARFAKRSFVCVISNASPVLFGIIKRELIAMYLR